MLSASPYKAKHVPFAMVMHLFVFLTAKECFANVFDGTDSVIKYNRMYVCMNSETG